MINEKAYGLGANRSCIRELFEYGRSRAPIVGPENVFDYSIGNPSIPSPPQVNQAIRDILTDMDSLLVHGYTSAAGDLEARTAISDDLNARYGVSTKPEEFFLGCGAAPELVSVFRALAVPGGEILTIAPYFPEYKPFAEEAGLIFRVVPPDIPGFQIDFSRLEAMITARTQAVLINTPNNPSGVVYTRETLTALGALLEKKAAAYGHPIYLISDEPYRDITYGKVVPYVPKYYPDTIVCYSYSKSLSLPGERIGYIFVPSQTYDAPKLYAAVAGAGRSMGYVCAPSLFQKVIGKCQGLTSDLSVYRTNRDLLLGMLREIGYECVEPDGAFYLFVKALEDDACAFSERAKKFDLLLVPGDDFGGPGYVRIAYCTSTDKIRRSRGAFEKLFADYRK